MAIFNNIENRIEDVSTEWSGKTGQQVEDFLSRNIVTSMSYQGNKLALKNNEGDTIAETTVTVELPTYDLDILLVAVRIDGTIYKQGDITMLCTSKSKVELAIAVSSTAYTPSAGTQNVSGAVKVKVSYGSKSSVISVLPYNIEDFTQNDNGRLLSLNKSDDELKWFDITDLFETSNTSTITASLVDNPQRYSTLGVSITNLVITLLYSGKFITDTALFALQGGLASNYHLQGYLGTSKISTESGVMLFNLLLTGLNSLTVRAVNNTNENIATDYISVDIINPTDFLGVAVAVNGVNGYINNHDTVELYTITVYSPSKEEVTISTYLNDTSDEVTKNVLDVIKVTAQSYTSDNYYETTYKKYIEINSNDAEKYLQVTVNGELYNFYSVGANRAYTETSKLLSISKVISEYLYTQSVIPSLNFDLIGGRTTTLFDNSPDYWKSSDGKVIYSVEALSNMVFETPVNLNLGSDFTLEFGFNSYNISDESKPVINFGLISIKPTTVCWNTTSEELYNARFAQFKEGEDTHVVITVNSGFTLDKTNPYYPDYFNGSDLLTTLDNNLDKVKFNLVRIYINGCIDREIKISDAELLSLRLNAALQINPLSSDLDLYLLRVYNSTSLTFDQVQHNYISFLSTRTLKDKFYDANDIVGNNGAISFNKVLGKYNSLVYVFPKGGQLPNRSWLAENNTPGALDSAAKNIKATIFINYADESRNKVYGGRIVDGLVKGLGSSAMRYLIWNTTFQLNKFKNPDGTKIKSIFTPYEDLDLDTNKFVENPSHLKKGYYSMPTYEGLTDTTETNLKVTKFVGKVNFASSMQSHKEGACKLYNDAYKKNTNNTGLLNGGRKAVHEEAFLYFYLLTDEESVENYELADLLNNSDVKFMGFLTWGSAKGDNVTFGYDSDKTPEYIMIEGGENNDKHVLFLRPWTALLRVGQDSAGNQVLTNFPTVSTEDQTSSNRDYSKNIKILDESITYNGKTGAWDVDFGLNDDGDAFTEAAKKSLNKFGEFVDFVYKHNYNLTKTSDTDTSNWDTTKRYIATVAIPSFVGSKNGDIYRYDEYINSSSATSEAQGGWVRAGLTYTTESGWSRLNIFEDFGIESRNINIAIDELKELFRTGISKYVDVNDIAFHEALIKFLSGTDNKAKNTYFLIFGKFYENLGDDENPNWQPSELGDYLVRLYGDDLDTIIATDNNGLQSKAYNLLEPAYNWDTRQLWGDNGMNAFFYMFDLLMEDIIKDLLSGILGFVYNTGSEEESNFYKFFYSILKDKYPAIAYNHTALIYYETALIVKDSGALGTGYDNNLIEPIELSHGSCLAGERQFMEKRKQFLTSYAKTALGGITYSTASSAGGGGMLQARIEFTPFLDFYPCYDYDKVDKYLITPGEDDVRSDCEKYLAKADLDYTVTIKESGAAINQGFMLTSLYKKLNITGLHNNHIDANLARVTDFTIDNNNLTTYKDFFGDNYNKFELQTFGASFPVLENLTLNNMNTLETLDLSSFNKLRVINLSNTTVKRVILPKNVKTLILPETIETFELYNPIEDVTFEGLDNLRTVDLSNVGEFTLDLFLESLLDCNKLESVSLRNLTINITEEVLNKLLSINNNITGTINIVDDSGNLKEISFDTKKKLVEIFGDIDNSSNNPKVNYKASADVILVTCDPEITIFGVGEVFNNPYNLVISSNLIPIISDPTPRLYIDYSTSSSNIAVDSKTGAITINKESSTASTVTIKVHQIGSSTVISKTVSVKTLWVAPLVGDFMYYDGTYSTSYNANKDIIGLVYAVEASDSENGTAYIIGTTNSTDTPLYSGFAPDGEAGSELLYIKDLYLIGSTLQNWGVIANATSAGSSDYINIETETNTLINNININTYKDFSNDEFAGKEDTAKYITAVNTKILPKMYTNYRTLVSKYIKYDASENKYYIDSLSDLLKLVSAFKITNVETSELSSCIIYPYLYAAYLYEPEVADLNEQFKKGNWYIPSVALLARIIYYRGYSAKGSAFNSGNFVDSAITSSISVGSTVLTKPIFSMAMKNMPQLPTVWSSIVTSGNTSLASNNITTTINASGNYNAYSYQGMAESYNNTAITYLWITGGDTHSYYDINETKYTAARKYTARVGVPFTLFNYSKNG